MVEVEVGEHHQIDVQGIVARSTDPVLEPGRVSLILDPVDLPELLFLLVAHPRVHEDEGLRGLHQQAAQGEGNPILFIGSDPALPERLRHHAEHGTPVQSLKPRLHRMDRQSAHPAAPNQGKLPGRGEWGNSGLG
jgi:hypothetical protein